MGADPAPVRVAPKAPAGPAVEPPSTPTARPDLSRVPGVVEAIPQNVYRATPYNDWPLFQIHVREGQRLRFRREGGKWVGDSPALFTQFETPAEIDGLKEEVELAEIEARSAGLALDVLRTDLPKELDAARIREQNAHQEFERLERLRDRTPSSQAEYDRARNAYDLARTQRERAESLLAKKLAIGELEAARAEHRLRRAESLLSLADFKREMSWGRVPVSVGRFEEVVVTRVTGKLGDVPSPAGKKECWVEVVDDRKLQARCLVDPELSENVGPGTIAAVRQGGRTFRGAVVSVGAVAEARGRDVPVLVEVENEGRALKLNTEVFVDLTGTGGPST